MNITKVTMRQYSRILNREGRDVEVNGTLYPVVFKKSSSKNAQEQLIIGYPQEYGWKKGTIFKFKDDYYLIINRSAVESDVYYTSVAKRCNVHWGTSHLVAGDLSSPNPRNGSSIRDVSGTIMLYTCESSIVQLNDKVVDFGGTYSCVNVFTIDGLTYYYFERTADISSDWTLTRTSTTANIKRGESDSVECKLTNTNSNNDTYYDTSASYSYIVSDDSIATIDQTGMLTGLTLGKTTVTCIATSGGKTYSLSFDISVVDADKEVTITHNGPNPVIYIGGNRTLTIKYLKDGDEVIEQPSWTFSDNYSAWITYTQPAYNKCVLSMNSGATTGNVRATAVYNDGTTAYIDLGVKRI